MATLRYTFRPSLFQSEHTIVLDDQGLVVREGGAADRRVPWTAIEEVHIEPSANAGGGDKARWLLHLAGRRGGRVTIDSVNVRGTADFEHKTDEFLAVLKFVHGALAGRVPPVRFRIGTRRGIVIAWQIALLMTAAVGAFGIAVAIATEEYQAILYAGVFLAFGVVGLMALRGKRGPKAYDPDALFSELSKPKSAT